MNQELFTERVLDRCRALGFAAAGVAEAVGTSSGPALRAWLAAGRHGEMAWLERNLDIREDPRRLLVGAKSVICVADRYAGVDEQTHRPRDQAPAFGRIARYARGDDYHGVMKRRLHRLADELKTEYPEERFRTCVDTAPILEREVAQRAGLGAIGKHTLLIEPDVGSWILLGEILTTLALTPAEPSGTDPCGSCTRCIDACPTDALTPWSLDATRCISYLSIEHRTAIDPAFHELMGDWVFGCDVCQEVCPHNQPTQRSRTAAAVGEEYAPRQGGFEILDVLCWSEARRREAFTRSSLKRAKLDMMKRNALIVAGNALSRRDDADLRERIEAIADDDAEPSVVRETARTVLRGVRRVTECSNQSAPRRD